MAEHDRDDEISKRYRELPREEPPRALDEAILAAARRELQTRPAPLVAPTGRRRWMFPVAAAAVIVLSAVVTLQVQRNQPDLEMASAPPASETAPPPSVTAPKDETPGALAPAPQAVPPASPEAKRAEGRVAKPKEPAPAQRERARSAGAATAKEAAKQPAPVLADRAQPKPQEAPRFTPDPASAPPAAAAPRAVPERDALEMRPGALARRADSMMAKSEVVAEPPERMLERIATLRREGRQKEADDLYAEFRKRFPDYRIPEAMREQVVPR